MTSEPRVSLQLVDLDKMIRPVRVGLVVLMSMLSQLTAGAGAQPLISAPFVCLAGRSCKFQSHGRVDQGMLDFAVQALQEISE